MRFRGGLLFFVLTILVAIGCRKPLTPNVDRNQPPETWITAAPQDTITIRDEFGVPQGVPRPGTIPFRYHLYWAGSDHDGDVAGFYFAVVETLPVAPPGLPIPPLPGPKPSDYHFTARTDSIFIFNVSEFSPDRQHAFFIYSVDNQGKADATPARLIFNALDRNPPLPIIAIQPKDAQRRPIAPLVGGAKGFGRIASMSREGVLFSRDTTIFTNDSLTRLNASIPTTDTIPATARIDIRWRGEPTILGTYVTGYRYKLDESSFVSVDSSVHTVSYNTGVAGDLTRPGSKVFTLRAVDQAGGAREVNRRFQMNFNPDTWFSGPDPNQYPIDPVTGSRSVLVTSWTGLPSQPGSLLSCDSLRLLPAQRPHRRTFFEIYKDRLYVRQEGDTVHMNSWVILHGGGLDIDSPYNIQIGLQDPDLGPDTLACGPDPALAVRPAGINGSPIGFKSQYTYYYYPSGPENTASQSVQFPLFDITSVFRTPTVAAYLGLRQSGKVYALLRSQDGNGAFDSRIDRARTLVEKVDAGMGTPEEVALRSRVITFFVDYPPRLAPSATPSPGQAFPSRQQLAFNMLAIDDDPFDVLSAPANPGGPSTNTIIRRFVRVRGKTATGADTAFTPTSAPIVNENILVFDIPAFITSENLTVEIELCDCSSCEDTPGSGRCATYSIPITAPVTSQGIKTSADTQSKPGPGQPQAVRSRTP